VKHRQAISVTSMLARLLAAGACALGAAGAQATQFELIYSGTFDSTEALNLASSASPTFFSGVTPFTVRAFFDDSTPNLAPPFATSFFGAYAPSSATIDIAGSTYRIESNTENATAGVTVVVFDKNNVFNLGRYGIGLIADPGNDGAGFVGDFSSAAPDFTVPALTPTLFTDYFGVGHGSSPCVPGTGMPPACQHTVVPWVLHDASDAAWSLSFGNYEEDYPTAHTPGATVGALNAAQIIAVPEPATYGLMLLGLAGLAGATRKRGQAPSAGPA
jgi:PEP-CTERM motif